jgi:hypothetical protein
MASTPPGSRTTADPAAAREGRFERAPARRDAPRRGRIGPETKHALHTTEFYAYVAATVAVLIAGWVTDSSATSPDRLPARDTWLIVGILTAAYMISRGIAKAGTRAARWEDDDRSDM